MDSSKSSSFWAKARDWFAGVDALVLVMIFVGVPAAILLTYFYDRHDSGMSFDSESWGQLGDFLGGVLNPFVALLTVLILIRTIRQNQDVIDISRKELLASRQALDATIEELKISRVIQEKTEGALNKQIELTIIAEGYRYHHGLVESSKEAMIRTAEHSTNIAKELQSLGIDVYEQFDPEVFEPNEMRLRENYLESVRLAEQAQGQFMSAKKMEREFGVALSEPALDLVRAYSERQANSPADAS